MCVDEVNSSQMMIEEGTSPPRPPTEIDPSLFKDETTSGTIFEPLLSLPPSVLRRRENRTLIFSRHGESEFNVQERMGGNSGLSVKGQRYAKAMGAYINSLKLPNLCIWTSTLIRTIQTAAFVKGPRRETSLLNEIDSGVLDGITFQEFEEKYPEECAKRTKDKFRYRYPSGESYYDCCRRVMPVLLEMERHTNLVIVAHQAMLRCIFGYLLNKADDEIPHIKIPQHTIIEVSFDGDTNVVDYFRIPVDHMDQGVTQAT